MDSLVAWTLADRFSAFRIAGHLINAGLRDSYAICLCDQDEESQDLAIYLAHLWIPPGGHRLALCISDMVQCCIPNKRLRAMANLFDLQAGPLSDLTGIFSINMHLARSFRSTLPEQEAFMKAARLFHVQYYRDFPSTNALRWDEIQDDKKASCCWAVGQIPFALMAFGLALGQSDLQDQKTIDKVAELIHLRWMMERISNGDTNNPCWWTTARTNQMKPWGELSDCEKEKDKRQAMEYPMILELFRNEGFPC